MTAFWCERAWLGGEQVEAGVRIETEAELITSLTTDTAPNPGDTELAGLVLPGLANAHSHAFHRSLRGRTHSGKGDFWAWREQMYSVASNLTPDNYYDLAAATYAEMAQAGITAVGEFHYVHHQPGGAPYDDPNAMGLALIAAAETAGIRLTLLDTCYLTGGVGGQSLASDQLRFSDGSAEAWRERVEGLASDSDRVHHGSAIHSVRAVDSASMGAITGRGGPVHSHVSEQPAENADCLAATGLTPMGLLDSAGVIGPDFSAIHATHLTNNDITILGRAGATAVFCPTTERDLADGIGPSVALREAGARLALGSDSNAVIDPFEEARAIELNERLRSGVRGNHSPADLWDMASANGHCSLGWGRGGRLAVGGLADLVSIRTNTVRTSGSDPVAPLGLIFSAGAADVDTVIVGGRVVVSNSAHTTLDVPSALARAIENLSRPTSTQ